MVVSRYKRRIVFVVEVRAEAGIFIPFGCRTINRDFCNPAEHQEGDCLNILLCHFDLLELGEVGTGNEVMLPLRGISWRFPLLTILQLSV